VFAQGEHHELRLGLDRRSSVADPAQNKSEARKRGVRGGRARSARALRKALLSSGETVHEEEGKQGDAARQDDKTGLPVAGANEKAVGARRSCLLAPHPLDLVVAADGKTKSEISGLDKAVAEALELHPCLRPAAVPRLWLAKGLHQLGRLLLFQEALILAGAPVMPKSAAKPLISVVPFLLNTCLMHGRCNQTAQGAKVAGRMRFTSKPQQGWGEVDSLHVYSSRPMPGLSPALAPVCSVWGASEVRDIEFVKKFASLQWKVVYLSKRGLIELSSWRPLLVNLPI